MRRSFSVAACLGAIVVGFLIPVFAFGHSAQGDITANHDRSKRISSDHHLPLWAVLATLSLLLGGAEGASASQANNTPTNTTSEATSTQPAESSLTQVTGNPSSESATTTMDNGDAPQQTTTAASTETTAQQPTTPPPASTEGATQQTTTPAASTATPTTTSGSTTSTTSTPTTPTSSSSKPESVKHQVRREVIAAFVSLIAVIACLVLLNYSLLKKERKRDPTHVRFELTEQPVVRFLLLSDDGRWATSKTLATTWTLALIWSITALALADLFGAPAGWQEFRQQAVSWQYLLLLGGPVTAAIGAQSLTLIRSQTGAEVKTTPPEGTSISQLYTDDDGKLNLFDVQYLAFNVLSILVFLVVFLAGFSEGLPVFPGVLATITAATAAGYLARRVARRADPVITSIAPPAAAPGEEIQLWGVNLTPLREPEAVKELSESERAEVHFSEKEIEVYFDGLLAPYAIPDSDETEDLSQAYRVKVPAGAKVRDGVSVIVNSGSPRGQESKPYTDFRVVGPTLAAVEPPLVQAGQQVRIWGTKLSGGDGDPQVFFNGQAGTDVSVIRGTDSTQDVVETTVPSLAAGTVKLKLLTAGGLLSNELELSVATAVRITEAPQDLTLGPGNPTLLVKGLGFRTRPAFTGLAAVFLAGQPLAVDQSSWQENQVTATLPTDPAQIARLGFSSVDEAKLVVRNDQGVSSAPWTLKLDVAEPEGDSAGKK